MLIDIVALVLGVWAVFKGWRNGLIISVFSFLAFIIGLAAALKLSSVTAEFIGRNTTISQQWLPFLAFAAVFILVVLLVHLGARVIEGLWNIAMLGWLNKLGGVVLYIFIHLLIISIVLFYAEKIQLVTPETYQSSVVYPYIQPAAPALMNVVGTILPFFKDMFADLELFFDGVSKKVS